MKTTALMTCLTFTVAFAQMVCAEQPLAKCKLQSLPEQPTPDPYAFQVGMSRTVVADPTDHYRNSGGDEAQNEESGGDPSRVRLLLETPTGELIVDVSVTVDGNPFRKIREDWIDEASLWEPDANKGEANATNNGVTAESVTETGDGDKTENEADEQKPSEKAVAHKKPGLRQRIVQYASQVGGIDREETRWLVSHWVGPAVLELREGISRQRCGVAPLLFALDQDGDGQLSGEEFSAAPTKIRQLDRNQNDELTMKELSQSTIANGSTHERPVWRPMQMMTLESSAPRGADVEFVVAIGGNEPGLTLIRKPDGCSCHTSEQAISLDFGAYHLELSALKSSQSETQVNLGQISIGTVVDGYPLFRICDRDGDRRLSLREMRNAKNVLASLDRNQDERLDSEEIPVALRLAIATGPNVHRALSEPTNAIVETTADQTTAPQWFLTMDENRDGDLSRGEFLGDDAQFADLDANGDRLVNVREAVKETAGE